VGRAAPAVLAVGFALWALLPAGGRDVPAQALSVGGFALLDLFFWTALADQREPRLAFGAGLAAMVMAIFSGLMMSDLVAGRAEAVALVAATILAAASVLMPSPAPVERAVLEPRADGFRKLSPREREALMHLANGLTAKEIAAVMGVSPGTARKLLERAYRKLGARNRVEAVSKMVSRG
jgi:DNA-binding CsgD family transcriptional regulator